MRSDGGGLEYKNTFLTTYAGSQKNGTVGVSPNQKHFIKPNLHWFGFTPYTITSQNFAVPCGCEG